MNRRPGQVRVTTEVAMCSFCGRPRTLRREEHVLGTLVRTIVTCETCHRTLSSTMGVAQPEPVEEREPVAAAQPKPEPDEPKAPKPKRASVKAAAPKKPAAKKPAAKKPAAAAKAGSKTSAKRSTTKK